MNLHLTRKQLIVLAVLGVVLLVAAGCTVTVVLQHREIAESEAMSALKSRDGAATYTDLTGNETDLTTYAGDVLVVNLWASWSPASQTELPRLAAIAREYEERGVRVLAVNRAEPSVTAQRFLKKLAVDQDLVLVLDPDDQYYKSTEGYSMPETIFYDRTGAVVHHAHGALSEEQLRTYTEMALTTDE